MTPRLLLLSEVASGRVGLDTRDDDVCGGLRPFYIGPTTDAMPAAEQSRYSSPKLKHGVGGSVGKQTWLMRAVVSAASAALPQIPMMSECLKLIK